MAIKAYLKNIAGAVLEPVAKSLWGISPNLSLGLSMFSDRVFRFGLSGRAAYGNKIFYTGANIIVRKMIEAPITFNKKKSTAKKSFSKFYSKTVSNPERNTIKAQSLDELPDHELASMFTIELMEDFWHNYNFGDGFLWFETLPEGGLSRNTNPVKVHSLRPDRIIIVTNRNRFDNIEKYTYTCKNGETIDLDKDSVLDLKHWNPTLDANMKGYGVDIVCAKDIALNDAGNEAEGAAYMNGGRGTLFSSKVDHVGEEGVRRNKLTVEQLATLKQDIAEDMQGARNNRRMKYTNGEVVVTPYGDTLAEMEINKSEDSRWKNIFAIMGIPKELSPATFSSSENSVDAGYKALVTNLVISELRKFDQKLTAVIKKWWPDIIAVSDITEYSELAPDLVMMKTVYGSPSIREDERRKIFGFDEIGGDMGKAILVPSGMMLLSDIVAGELEVDNETDAL